MKNFYLKFFFTFFTVFIFSDEQGLALTVKFTICKQEKGEQDCNGEQDYNGEQDCNGEQDYKGKQDYDGEQDYSGKHDHSIEQDYKLLQVRRAILQQQPRARTTPNLTPEFDITELRPWPAKNLKM